MKNDKEEQQRLGAVINNKLGISLKEQAEILLPHINRLGWYNVESGEVADPNLIRYYFLNSAPGSIFFYVMKMNSEELDYSLLEAVSIVDDENYKLFIDEYVPHLFATTPEEDKGLEPVLDIVIFLRDYKLSKLVDVFNGSL